MYLWVSLLRIG